MRSSRFVSATAHGAPSPIPAHSAATVASTSALTCVTRPIERAAGASKGSPVSIAAAIWLGATRAEDRHRDDRGSDPDADLRECEGRRLLHHDEIAGCHQADPTRTDGTLDGSDRRTGRVHESFERTDERSGVTGRAALGGALLQVGTGTERRTGVR